MSRETQCRRAENLMDDARSRDLSPEESAELEAHLETCADCRAVAQVGEKLRPLVAITEEDVPDGLTADMWTRVERRLPPHPRPSRRSRWWTAPRLVPALAATAVVLLLGLGLLAGQLRDLQDRERRLSSQLDRQEELIRDLQLRQGAAGADPRTDLAKLTALTRGGETTVGEFLRLLDRLPPESDLLPPEATRTLMRRVTAAVGETVAAGLPDIETADGLQAGEAVTLLAAFPLDPEQKISRTRLHVMSRGIGL